MTTPFRLFLAFLLVASPSILRATQADDTTVTIVSQNPGPTSFITNLTLSVSDIAAIKDIQFTIAAKPGTFARPLSATYAYDFLLDRGDIVPQSGTVYLPVYGLYAGFGNTVTLTYHFRDGSSKQAATTITTAAFDDEGCGYNSPTVLKARSSAELSYDYIFIRSGCGNYSPVIVDSDGNLRWVSPLSVSNALAGSSLFYQGSVFAGVASVLYRVDLDGTISPLHDFGPENVVNFHHNIDPGKAGLLVEVDTTTQFESVLYDVDFTGAIVKIFNMADIIGAAMTAGGDDPSQFVYPAPTDWFHNNAATYNRADDSVIVSSRENFVISVDYKTGAIKWILGDQTKHWHQFPSLAAFALDMTPGSLPPVGQHGTSLTYDNDLLLFDDGYNSQFQQPSGVQRTYSSPRKYQLNLTDPSNGNGPGTATVVWNYEQNQTVYSAICSSAYEDAPNNYLIDYAAIGFPVTFQDRAQILGLNSAGQQVFYYEYPTALCNTAYNSLPIHLESMSFPIVGPQPLNLSTRGEVSNSANSLILGFIVTGTANKDVALRVLGPSLDSRGLAGFVPDPALTLYNSSGAVIATNDDWAADPRASDLTANGLAPTNASEAATVQTLAPGAYTVVTSSADGTAGTGLVEAYDLSPSAGSQLANLSTRGLVGQGDQVLIGGLIEGSQANGTIIIRALGPSLSSAGIDNALANPYLTVYDSTGTAIAANDDWADATNSSDLVKNGLAPTQDFESALVLHPPAGNFTAIITGAAGGTGVALLEIYSLDP